MKLKNKKTGEIIDIHKGEITLHYEQGRKTIHFKRLEDLEEWEDYEEPKEYWFIDTYSYEVSYLEERRNEDLDNFNKEIGNYFETREEAELAVRKLKAWKLLKDKCNIKFNGLIRDNRGMLKGVKLNYEKHQATFDEARECMESLYLLFGGEE